MAVSMVGVTASSWVGVMVVSRVVAMAVPWDTEMDLYLADCLVG